MMEVKVLGPGCSNCRKLYEVVEKALRQSGLAANLTKVEDYQEIMRYGVLSTPALVVNGDVVSAGRVPDLAQVSSWLTSGAAEG